MSFKQYREGWLDRLDREVKKLRDTRAYGEFTLNRLKDIVRAPNEAALLRALASKISDGQLSVVYRVLSPKTNASLATYKSPLDVPDTILDVSTGEEIDIDRFQNVEAVYISGAPVVR